MIKQVLMWVGSAFLLAVAAVVASNSAGISPIVASPADFAPQPLSVAVAPDGRIWLGMWTDTLGGGVVAHDADLSPIEGAAWALHGPATGIAVSSDGDVFVTQKPWYPIYNGIWRYNARGQHQSFWSLAGLVGRIALADNDEIAALMRVWEAGRYVLNVTFYGADGAVRQSWPTDEGAADLTVTTGFRTLIAAARSSGAEKGAVLVYDKAGVLLDEWATRREPVALDQRGDGLVAVLGRGDVWNESEIEMFDEFGRPLRQCYLDEYGHDIAFDHNGQLLVVTLDEDATGAGHLYRLNAECSILGVQAEFALVSNLPIPATATPRGGVWPTPTPLPSASPKIFLAALLRAE